MCFFMYMGWKVKWWPEGTLVIICEHFSSEKKKEEKKFEC